MSIVPVTDQGLDQLANLFRMLGDKTRLKIILLLAEGDRNVTSLCEQLSVPQSTVSHHLGLLRINHLIGNRRNGKQVVYTLNGPVGSLSHADSHAGSHTGSHAEPRTESHRMMIDTGVFQVSIKRAESHVPIRMDA